MKPRPPPTRQRAPDICSPPGVQEGKSRRSKPAPGPPEADLSSPERSFLVLWLLLLVWALGGFSTWLLLFPSRRPRPPRQQPATCPRWLKVSGTLSRPGLVCLSPRARESPRRALQRLLRQRGSPSSCLSTVFGGRLPLPRAGQHLHLLATSQGCRWRLSWMTGAHRVLLGLPLDPNRDPAKALAAIPGLSPRKAKSIVRYRKKHGPFSSLEDLVRIKGIGWATLRRLRPYLQLSPQSKPR